MKLTRELLINMITEAIQALPGEANFLEMMKMNNPFTDQVPDPRTVMDPQLARFLMNRVDKTYFVQEKLSGAEPIYDLSVVYGGQVMVSSNEPDIGVINGAVAQLQSQGYMGNM